MTLAIRTAIDIGISDSPDENGIGYSQLILSKSQASGRGVISLFNVNIADGLKLRINDYTNNLEEEINGPVENGQFVITWDGTVTPIEDIYFQVITTSVITEGVGCHAEIMISSVE